MGDFQTTSTSKFRVATQAALRPLNAAPAATRHRRMQGRNEKAIREYVRNQLQEDIAADQISLKEFKDPFTGEPVGRGK